MTRATDKEPFTHWYQEPWVWFIIGLLATSMLWGVFQVTTAFKQADSVVIADYYQHGKTINADLTRQTNAEALNIEAILHIDELTGEIRASVAGDFQSYPTRLKLSFLSPVFADDDRIISLNRSISGEYIGQLTTKITGRYYIQLETLDTFIPEVGYETGWQLNKKTIISPDTHITL